MGIIVVEKKKKKKTQDKASMIKNITKKAKKIKNIRRIESFFKERFKEQRSSN